MDLMLSLTSQIVNVCFVCLPVLAAAQNNASPGWEAKLVEFFKDKLKQTDTQTSVMESSETLED